MQLSVIFIVLLIMCTDIIDAVSQILLKMAVNSLRPELSSLKKAAVFILSLLCRRRLWLSFIFGVFSLSIWLFVLSKAELNFAYSIDSMRYVFVAFAAVIFLKERIGPLRWLGIATIVCGILLVSLS
jgi:undecaprenyl phosphate-alpha-L-ara4N flippase subunit ArnE